MMFAAPAATGWFVGGERVRGWLRMMTAKRCVVLRFSFGARK